MSKQQTIDPKARCRWCGKTYAEHADKPLEYTPRMPCAGEKAYFLERYIHNGTR